MTGSRNIALAFPGCHRRGGVERIVFETARYLASRDHRVTVFANEWEADDQQPSIVYRRVEMRQSPGFLHRASYLGACTRELALAGRFDVLNTHGCICPFGGVLRVHSLHRDWLHQSRIQRGAYSPSAIKQRLNPMHPVLLRLEAMHFRGRRYQRVIALSVQVREALNRYYGVPAEDVDIVPNGFAPDEFSPEIRLSRRQSMRDKLGLKSDQTVLLFVANELERKGFSTVIDAVAQLKRDDVRLLVVGKTDKAAVEAIAAKAGVETQVVHCGPTRDVAGFHAASDLFVLPTQYEAFCLAILEALGSGLPVITSIVPGARDAIVPGINGALVTDPKSGSELAIALQPFLDRNYRETAMAQTAATVAEYTWPQVMAAFEAILLQYAS